MASANISDRPRRCGDRILLRCWGLVWAMGVCLGQPAITRITNAALPGMDQTPGYLRLSPNSLATIFGNGLADFAVSAPSPWPSDLGGTEVHLLFGADSNCAAAQPNGVPCEIAVDLLYVSPSQINFLVPSISPATYGSAEVPVWIVLIRDGVRFDIFRCTLPNCIAGPGLFWVSSQSDTDFAVFNAGYDCLFSLASASCGLSGDGNGQGRVAILTATDLQGNLISSSNPVRIGQPITIWATGALPTAALSFGISQYGVFTSFWQAGLLWEGQSPQFAGLDQINLTFPSCSSTTKATAESRYDASMGFLSASSLTDSGPVLYLAFLVEPGDPDCDWQR